MNATMTLERRSEAKEQTSEAPRPAAHRVDRAATARHLADELMAQQPDWVTFFREAIGVGGIVDELFPTPADRLWFEGTEESRAINGMLAELRDRPVESAREPTRVITVRLPKSLHESLRQQAHDHETSMNQLCISRLLRVAKQA